MKPQIRSRSMSSLVQAACGVIECALAVDGREFMPARIGCQGVVLNW